MQSRRPEKVQDKPGKERIRKGTKSAKSHVVAPEPEGLDRFVNRIICGDAVQVLSAIPSAAVDLVITSPPYNFGHAYAGDPHDDTRDWNEYFRHLSLVWRECARVLKPGGRIAVNVQPLFSDYIPTHHIISRQLWSWASSGRRRSSGRSTTIMPSTRPGAPGSPPPCPT